MGLVGVGAFAVFGEVEADGFGFGVDAEADGGIDEFEEDEGDDTAEGGGDEDADELVDELGGATGEGDGLVGFGESIGDGGVDLGVGEEAEHEHADDGSEAMDAEDVEGIVVVEDIFEFGDGVVADRATGEADEAGSGDGDEA